MEAPIGALAHPIVSLLRPHQCGKNLLVFAPAFFAGATDPTIWEHSLWSALVMTLLAMAAYCLNDVHDAAHDRLHPQKRLRPVASGEVAAGTASAIGIILIVAGLSAAWCQSAELLQVAAGYSLLQVAYTSWARAVVIVDLLALSSFYIIRVLAGVAATGIQPSAWILITVWLLALLLGVGKRLVELRNAGAKAGEVRKVLGDYNEQFLQMLHQNLVGLVTITYLLWCAETVETHRFNPLFIYPTSLLVVYGLLRYELLVIQNRFPEDPTIGLLRDRGIVIATGSFIVWMALLIRAAR